MAVFVSIAIIIISLCFWLGLSIYQGFHIRKYVELAAVNISQEITVNIENRILALTRMAQRWEVGGGTSYEEWTADATNYVHDYSGYKALGWANSKYEVCWLVPESEPKEFELINLLLEEHRSISETTKQHQNPELTPTVILERGVKGFLIYVPLFVREKLKEQLSISQSKSIYQYQHQKRFDGFIVGVFQTQSLIDSILDEKIKREFAVEVFEGRNKIYRSSDIDFDSRIENRWSQEKEIKLGNVIWRLRIYPQPAFLRGEYSPLKNFVLSNGLITPALLTWAIYLMQSSQKYAKEVETKNRELANEVSERQKVEEELRDRNKALESAVVGISKLDVSGHYLKVNPAYADLLGYKAKELKGSTWQQTVHPEDREKANKAYERMLASEKAEIEVRAVRKDGSVFDKILVMVKAYDSEQRFSGHYGFMKDISQRREVERLKDEFISVVSHELRTPLTSIRGSLGLLAGGVLQTRPEQAQRMLQIAINNSDRLIRLINNILDIERIESGEVQMNKQICDVANLIHSAIEVIRDIAQKAGINLSVDSVSARIWADPDRIIQVLTNLLSNAIKFSPSGSTVWLTAEVKEAKISPQQQGNLNFSNSSTPYILFQVRDQGRGIPADKLESIFGRFQQVDASDSRKKGGTGLGLAICRSIIQQHCGFIWAQSTENEGSTFYCQIPLSQEEEAGTTKITYSGESSALIKDTSSKKQSKTQQTSKVLIVEDDTDLAQVIISIFQRHGIETYHAKSGQEALEQSLALLPDLMILDLTLPLLSGFDVVEKLRQHQHLSNLPLVVYTAFDLSEKDQKRLKLGKTLLLTKARVTPEEFEQRAINLLRRVILQDKESSENECEENSNY